MYNNGKDTEKTFGNKFNEKQGERKMKIKVIKNGFKKKSLNHWKLNKWCHCFNILGIAVFISK